MLSADHHHVQQKQSHRLCDFDQIMKKSLLILKILEKSSQVARTTKRDLRA